MEDGNSMEHPCERCEVVACKTSCDMARLWEHTKKKLPMQEPSTRNEKKHLRKQAIVGVGIILGACMYTWIVLCLF